MTPKESIREAVRERRMALDPAYRDEQSLLIHERFFALDVYTNAETIAFYAGKADEVMTFSMIERAFGDGKQVAMPRAKNDYLEWRWITSLGDLSPGAFSIPEPSSSLPLAPLDEIQMILVPGIAFDLEGNRIGYGKGYYDKALDAYEGITVGLAFQEQIVDLMPVDDWDQPVTMVITPSWPIG